MFVPKRIIHTVDKKHVKLVLPFLGHLSFEIRSCLQKCFKNYIPHCTLKVVYQSKKRISNLFYCKNVANTKLGWHLFYQLMCRCCNATYYGQTQRQFLVRASEHLRITSLTINFGKTLKESAILIMLLDGHKASFDSFFLYLKKKTMHSNYNRENLC